MRARIADVIEAMTDFPSIAGIVNQGCGAFSLSSARRNLDLVDAAQEAYNAARRADGLPTGRSRTDRKRTPRQDEEFERLRMRCIDLEKLIDCRDATILGLVAETERLEALVGAFREAEAKQPGRRSPWREDPK